MRTSYSAIETYLQCPQKYKFQEIDRLKVPKSDEAVFGSLIHDTLKFMFKRNPLFPTLDEVVAYFRENWPAPEKLNWNDTEQKTYFTEGVRMLKRFYESNAPWNFTVVDLESRFEVAITDEKSGETHILAGIIDRIDKQEDGKYEIIDYKTSRRMPSQEALDKNLQLSLYSLGLQKRWPHLSPEEITLSLYFLKHGEKLSTKTTTETTEKTKEHILATISEIQERLKSNKEFEPMPGPLCDWCGFKPLCPAWKHLYRKQEAGIKNKEEADATITEYLSLKKQNQATEVRLAELQSQIKKFMEERGLTRVFGEEGYISKKLQQRYEYDLNKIKELLSPLGKWEEILKADEIKLKKILKEIPEATRQEIENARRLNKEYSVLTVAMEKIKR